jgi:Lon protease-like protein
LAGSLWAAYDIGMTEPESFVPGTAVPLFPLPNCVLLPGGVLPLHVFEPRYREMAADLLASNKLLAMALLKPGYEAKYYTNSAEIHPVVCLGEVLSHEKLADGCYNLLLQGRTRARVRQEDRQGTYRSARVDLVRSLLSPSRTTAAAELLKRLREHLESEPFAGMKAVQQLMSLFENELSIGDLCDVLTHSLIPQSEVEVRQQFLETADVIRRMEHLICEVRTLGELVKASRERLSWFDRGRDN